jgi:hypothetical protein
MGRRCLHVLVEICDECCFAAGKGLKALSRVWHLEQRNSSSSNHNQNHGGSYGERCVESQPSL